MKPATLLRSVAATVSAGVGALMIASCGGSPTTSSPTGAASTQPPPLVPTASDIQKRLAALEPARPLAPSEDQKRLATALDQYFQRAGTQRLYVHLDKPLYRPGETMWFRMWELATPSLSHGAASRGVHVSLISPKGAAVIQKRVRMDAGVAANDFVLPPTVQGGEYIVRVVSDTGASFDRKVIVSQYQPPRIKKKLEFLRKAYGAGDDVSAGIALHRATGEPLAAKQATAIVTVDEAEVGRFAVQTDPAGNGIVKFTLPARIARGDGLLTILVEDGGVTESIQKRIPITVDKMDVQLFPEGGELVAGLPGRVYFMAKNLIGKPADIEGRVLDDRGAEVAQLRSFHNGLGRFELTPAAGRRYTVEITRPAGIAQKVDVPAANEKGCVMQSVDDVTSERDDLRVGIWCSESRTVIVTASLREKRLGDVSLAVGAGEPAVASIPVPIGAQGAARVTVFDEDLRPLAERLVYRNRGADLKVSLAPQQKSYTPREAIALDLETRDLAGKPVSADLSLAVVDDTVLSFADDKNAHLLARLYLESEMPGQEIEEPNFYFSGDPKAAHALDLVLGTQGWRRFDWQPVLSPPRPVTVSASGAAADFGGDMVPMAAPVDDMEFAEAEEAPMAPPPMEGAADAAKPKKAPARAARRRPAADPAPMGNVAGPRGEIRADGLAGGVRQDRRFEAKLDLKDEDWAGAAKQAEAAWAPVRVFPVPSYSGRYDGPRTDFRETIYWQPSVKTDDDGRATVRFFASDAVTSFRAIAEGVTAGGLAGRAERVFDSRLPVSLAVKMPLEVSAGDRIRLPVTISNETDRAYDAVVATQFGAAFKVGGGIPATVKLGPGERKSFFATLEVVGDGKDEAAGEARIAVTASNLKDEVSRTIKVVPLGFPQEASAAGTLEKAARHELDLAGALPGSIDAQVTLYPSPLATMVQGTEAIIREPVGCFEQASSANYPNIMVLGYLEEHDAADPDLVARTMGMLDRGYQKLVGYESPEKGYEWFGGDPGHEALTAYGLMEFADMTRVYGDVDRQMIARTAAWLKARRDGKGGYQRNARALDSFGRASAEVTNAYITYALTEAGEKAELGKEIAAQKKLARETSDPYLLALAANTLVNVEPGAPDTRAALARLRKLQGDDGGFKGADHSITRSGGSALDIESTSLAVLALVNAGEAASPPVRKAIEWLNANRSGYGSFSSTQSTVLALKAMTRYADASRATPTGGTIILRVNGKRVASQQFDKGHEAPLVFADLAAYLRPGKNTVELALDSGVALPYSVAISYRSKKPASSPQAVTRVAARLQKEKVAMGEGVRMKVRVENTTDQGQPMTLARVGIPGGLTFQTWQLDELKDKGAIDFYETREREVVLYFRSLAPKAVKDVDLDLLAAVPGDYVAPASQAYLYYTDEHRHWIDPARVTVTR